ncbi:MULTISPECIES: hypothetical protein [unclassified Nonomuraea]|uniref:hypothetical protein n=1 Tax=unclassified Nonomuraea TaxID=2593643 RepID=UPI0034041F53
MINGPAFDPLFRSDVITLPADHAVYEWACSVLECERPRVNQQIDLCGAHRDEWTIFSSENPGDEARAAFRRLATPLPRAEGYEPPPCRVCPGRPAFANEHQLCTRHMRRWRHHLRYGGTEEDFDTWAAEQDALPPYGNCGTTACERMATTPLGLCRFHDRSYREQGQPGGARLPDLWERYYERQGQPVPVLTDDIREFQRWCAQQGPPPNPNQINLVGLRPLVKAELQWGLEAHTRIAEPPGRRPASAIGHRTMKVVKLDAMDAIELSEMLEFIKDWLTTDDQAKARFAQFVGCPGYDAADLCADADRFVFLLGGNDGEYLFSQD